MNESTKARSIEATSILKKLEVVEEHLADCRVSAISINRKLIGSVPEDSPENAKLPETPQATSIFEKLNIGLQNSHNLVFDVKEVLKRIEDNL